LLGLASGQLDAQGQREARTLLRAALRPLLGEKPMHSRRLYQQYLQLRG
jgi:recombinational DNA repair protein (RecF pathway)